MTSTSITSRETTTVSSIMKVVADCEGSSAILCTTNTHYDTRNDDDNNIVIHNTQDGTTTMTNNEELKLTMEQLRYFFSHYSPQPQKFGFELQQLFDDTFHKDIQFVVNGQEHGYDFMINQVTKIFAEGSTIEHLQMGMMEVIPSHNTQNDNSDVVKDNKTFNQTFHSSTLPSSSSFWYSMSYSQGLRHYNLQSVAEIRDGKVWRVTPMKDISSSYQDIFDHNNNNNDNINDVSDEAELK